MNKTKLEAIIWLIVFILIGVIYSWLLSPTIKIVGGILAFIGKGKYRQFGINVWEGVDNSMSADTGGDPDESLSSRLGKARKRGSKGWGFIANKVDLVFGEFADDPNHCDRTTERDEGKKQVTTY